MSALVEAVEALLGVDPDAVGDGELAAAMVSFREAQARLGAVTVALTAMFDARRVYGEDGSRSVADWIATACRLPKPQVAGEVRLGRRLRSMPVTRAALGAGEIELAHARKLAGLAANPRTAGELAAGEELLVSHARTLRFDDFERTCDHWRDAADPDGPERRRGRDNQLRRVHLSAGLGGVGLLDGYLTAPKDGKRPRPLVTVMPGYETFAGRLCELAGGTAESLGQDDTLIERVVFDGPNCSSTSARPAAFGASCAECSRSSTGAARIAPATSPPTAARATTSSPGARAG